jgi:hypothetical protein
MGLLRTTARVRRRRKRRRAKARAAIPSVRAVRRALGAPRQRTLGRRAASPLDAVKRSRWKLLGVAGMAGVAATGVVVARARRARSELGPDELRERLHERLAATGAQPEQPAVQAADPQAARAVGQESRPAASQPPSPRA